jgi:hypothetical protein
VPAPSPSNLDAAQVLQHAFDEASGSLRVEGTLGPAGGAVEITDGVNNATLTNVGGKEGLDVNVINDVVLDINQSTDSIAIGDGTNLVKVDADGSLNVDITGLSSFQTSQYTIGTSSVKLTPTPLTDRSGISIKATTTSTNAIYIGNSSSVTSSTGFPLFNGDTLQMDLTGAQTIYAISSIPSQTLYVLEIGN